MKHKIGISIVVLLFLIVLTGCWGKQELNELAIAAGLSIDKSDDGYEIGVQLVNPSEVSPQQNASGLTPVVVHKEKGQTIYEGIRKLSLDSPRRIYMSQLRLLVISDEVAEDGIQEILDYLSRDTDFRSDFFVMIAKDKKAQEILKIQMVTDKIPASALYSLFETSGKYWAETVAVNAKVLSDALTIPGKNPVLSGMSIEGDIKEGETTANMESSNPPAEIVYTGLGVLEKDKLVGWISEKEAKGYNYITNNIVNTIENIKCPGGGDISMVITHSKTNQRAKFIQDGQPKIELDIRTKANIGEADCSIALENQSEIKALEKALEEKVTDIINNTIEKVQEDHKTDIFGFGETIYRSHPKKWKELRKDWKEQFANLKVNVKVKVNIKQTGTTGNSLIKDVKE